MGMDSNGCWLGNYCQDFSSGGCPAMTGLVNVDEDTIPFYTAVYLRLKHGFQVLAAATMAAATMAALTTAALAPISKVHLVCDLS